MNWEHMGSQPDLPADEALRRTQEIYPPSDMLGENQYRHLFDTLDRKLGDLTEVINKEPQTVNIKNDIKNDVRDSEGIVQIVSSEALDISVNQSLPSIFVDHDAPDKHRQYKSLDHRQYESLDLDEDPFTGTPDRHPHDHDSHNSKG